MSVLDRLNRLVRANLNDLASRASGRRVFGEVRDTLRQARSQLVESRMAEKRLAEEYEGLLDESQSWEERAALALRSGDEGLARRALERKYEVDRRAAAIKQDLDAHRAHLTDLMRSLEAIEVKLQALRERRAEHRYEAPPVAAPSPPTPEPPPSRHEPSDAPGWARLEADAELGTMGDSELFDTFDVMSDRLTRAEAELDAIRELNSESARIDPLDDDLESRFRELETGRDLDRLKKRATSPLDDLRRRLDEE